MGGANNRSLISAHFCISAYFLTAETYKRMRLTTRVYGICISIRVDFKKFGNLWKSGFISGGARGGFCPP